MNNVMSCARPLCISGLFCWNGMLEWNAGMEYWNGLNCYKYLIQYTVIMQIKRKIQFSARNSILRIYGRI